MEARSKSPRRSRHHLVPKSRCRELGLDPDDHRNVKLIPHRDHRRWHNLWDNLTPYEVLAIIQAAINKGYTLCPKEWQLLFGVSDLPKACQRIQRRWCPPADYYSPEKLPSVQDDVRQLQRLRAQPA